MTFHTVYRDTASIVGNHGDDRDAAVRLRHAVTVALADPELSLIVGVVELNSEGRRVGRFASASDLLERADPVAVAVAGQAPTSEAQDVEATAKQPRELDAEVLEWSREAGLNLVGASESPLFQEAAELIGKRWTGSIIVVLGS